MIETYSLMRELERLRGEGYDFREVVFVPLTGRAKGQARKRARRRWCAVSRSRRARRAACRDGAA